MKPRDSSSSAGENFGDCCITAAVEANTRRYGHHHQLAPIERAAVLKDFAKLREKLDPKMKEGGGNGYTSNRSTRGRS
jgi:hypothetical protein